MSIRAVHIIQSRDNIQFNKSKTQANIAYRDMFEIDKVKKIALTSYDFVYNIDNVNELTKTAYFETAIQSYSVTLIEGKYNYVDLAAQIETKLNLLGLGIFSVNFFTEGYKIISPTPIKFITNPLDPYGKDWADMVGMPKDDSLSTTKDGKLYDISYTDCIFVCSKNIHSFKEFGDTSSSGRLNDVLAVIYVNQNQGLENDKIIEAPNYIYGKHITGRIDNPKYVNIMSDNMSTLDIRLLDDSGQPLPGINYKYTLELMSEI